MATGIIKFDTGSALMAGHTIFLSAAPNASPPNSNAPITINLTLSPFLLYCFLGFRFHCVSGSQKLCIVLHKIQAYNSHLFHIQYNCCDTFFLFFGHIFHLPFRYFVLTFLVTFPILVLQGTDMPEYVERGKIIWHLFHHHFKMIFQI